MDNEVVEEVEEEVEKAINEEERKAVANTFAVEGLKEYEKFPEGMVFVRDISTDITYMLPYDVVKRIFRRQFTDRKLEVLMSKLHSSQKIIIDHDNKKIYEKDVKYDATEMFFKDELSMDKISEYGEEKIPYQKDLQELHQNYGIQSFMDDDFDIIDF